MKKKPTWKRDPGQLIVTVCCVATLVLLIVVMLAV